MKVDVQIIDRILFQEIILSLYKKVIDYGCIKKFNKNHTSTILMNKRSKSKQR